MKKLSLIFLIQFSMYLFFYIPIKLFWGVDKNKNYKFKNNSKYIFASNHFSQSDPIYFVSSLSILDSFRIFPIRFIAREDVINRPILGILLNFLGCISTKPKSKKTLRIAEELLMENQSIYFFVKGALDRYSEKKLPKVGAIYLNNKVPNSTIVPIKISKHDNKVFIDFKNEFKHNSSTDNLQIISNKLWEKITY